MIMDKLKTSIHSVLDDNLSTPFDYTKIYGLEYCAEEIIKLLTPKLEWSNWMPVDSYYCKAGCQEFWLLKIGDNIYHASSNITQYQLDNLREFEGTLEECKQFCSDKILSSFLKLCQ